MLIHGLLVVGVPVDDIVSIIFDVLMSREDGLENELESEDKVKDDSGADRANEDIERAELSDDKEIDWDDA